MQAIEAEMEEYFDRLFPICRSITGTGYQESLDIIREIIPLEKIDFPTGTACYDWTIPEEWNIRDAYIVKPEGRKIADFKKNSLHVVGYSEPTDQEVSLQELRDRLHSLPESPRAIPYVTSYYKRTWGFCIDHDTYRELREGTYHVFIDSELRPGKLTIGMLTLPGETDEELFLSTYLCHPSMAINELSGPLVTAFLYRRLKELGPFRHTIRFLFCPENIGAIAFLSLYGEQLKSNLKAGYVVNCVGHGEHYTYKKSRDGNTLADRTALNVLTHTGKRVDVVDFFPDGSDERQYCSPGFNLPVGLIMRTMYSRYHEYHTSLDNKDIISFSTMRETIETYAEVLLTLDRNKTYKGKVQYGTPQLSKSPVPLYDRTMDTNKYKEPTLWRRQLLNILNYSDGTKDLLYIAERGRHKMLDLVPICEKLVSAGYLQPAEQ